VECALRSKWKNHWDWRKFRWTGTFRRATHAAWWYRTVCSCLFFIQLKSGN